MQREKEEARDVTVHKDLILLIKEYARKGFKETRGGTNAEFERLWGEAFHLTESHSVRPAKL